MSRIGEFMVAPGFEGAFLKTVNGQTVWALPNLSLEDLTDVDLTGQVNGHILRYAGDGWYAVPLPEVDLSQAGLFRGTWNPTPDEIAFSEDFSADLGQFTGNGVRTSMASAVGTSKPPYSWTDQGSYAGANGSNIFAQLDVNGIPELLGRTITRWKVWHGRYHNTPFFYSHTINWDIIVNGTTVWTDSKTVSDASPATHYPWQQYDSGTTPPSGLIQFRLRQSGGANYPATLYMALTGLDIYAVPENWTGYMTGHYVVHEGTIYESTADNNLSEPGTVGAFWTALPVGSDPLLDYGTDPIDANAGAESAGSLNSVSRSDHKHHVTVDIPISLSGAVPLEGVSESLARADHQHGIPTGIPQANIVDLVADLAALDAHAASTANPHAVTKTQVGLGNVDDTSDLNKPLSTAAVDALAIKADLVGGFVPTSQIPALATTQTTTVADATARLAQTSSQVQPGDVTIQTDTSERWLLAYADPSVAGNWILLDAPGASTVTSVNGQSGTVVLGPADVGAAASGHSHDVSTLSGAVTDAQLPARLKQTASTITDWNTAIDSGWYMGIDAANAPKTGSIWFIGEVRRHNASYVQQFITGFTGTGTDEHYWRQMRAGSWSPWYRQVTSREYDGFGTGDFPKVVQGSVLGGSLNYLWRNFVCVGGHANGATLNPIVIRTSIPSASTVMFQLRITGYNYGSGEPADIDVVLSGYTFTSGLVNCFWSNKGSVYFSSLRYGFENGLLVLELTPQNSQGYNKYRVDAMLGHSSNSGQYFSGWTITTEVAPTLTGVVVPVKQGVDDTTWFTPTLFTGWTNYGNGYDTVGYRKVGNRVFLKGMVARSSTVYPSQIFTLAAGFRPALKKVFLAYGATNAILRIDVDSGGGVVSQGTVTAGGTQAYVSLEQVSFIAEQ